VTSGEGPFRVGRSWGVTIIYDPDYDPDATAKTGMLMATAQSPNFARTIVAALNLSHATTAPNPEEKYEPARGVIADLLTAPTCGREIVPGWLCARPIFNGMCQDHGQVR
jgi:hypothetical protein